MAETCSVFLKLPQFWADGAKIWFQQTESQFLVCNISAEQTKYHHVVLSSKVAVKLKNVFENVPEVDQYRLLQKFSLTVLRWRFFPLKQIFLAMHFRDLLTKNFHGKFFARTIKDLTVVSVIFIHDGT